MVVKAAMAAAEEVAAPAQLVEQEAWAEAQEELTMAAAEAAQVLEEQSMCAMAEH